MLTACHACQLSCRGVPCQQPCRLSVFYMSIVECLIWFVPPSAGPQQACNRIEGIDLHWMHLRLWGWERWLTLQSGV